MATVAAYVLDHLGVTGGVIAPADAKRFLTRGFTRRWNDANVRARLLVTGSSLGGGEAVLAQPHPGRGGALQLGQDDRNQGFLLSVQPWQQSSEAITTVVATIKARQQSGRLPTVTSAVLYDLIWLDQQVMVRLGTGANPVCVAYQVELDVTTNQDTRATIHLPEITFIAA